MASQPAGSWGAFQPSLIPDVATAQTVAFMCKLVNGATKHPAVQRAARDAVQRFGNEPDSIPGNANLARAAWWFAKYTVNVLPHEQFKQTVAAFPEKKQLLLAPEFVLTQPRPEGDCSAFTMLIAALLKCLGVRCELVTLAVDPREPEVFTHVYPRAVLEDGQRLALDASHGNYPGWEVPAYDVHRKQIWDTSGSPIPDSAAVSSRLHEYVRGLGDDVTTLPDLTGSAAPAVPYVDDSSFLSSLFSTPVASVDTGAGSGFPQGSLVAPAQNSANWAGFATALAKSGMTLAEINAIQPGTVVGANGQILRQATGLAVPVGTGISVGLGTGTGTILLLGGAALFLVFMMMNKSRG